MFKGRPRFLLRVSLESPETPRVSPGPQTWPRLACTKLVAVVMGGKMAPWPAPHRGKRVKGFLKGWHGKTRPYPTKREHLVHTHIICIFIYYRYTHLWLSSSISISRTSKTLQDWQPNPHQDHVDLRRARPPSQSSSYEPLDLTLKEKFIHLNCVPTRWASENQLEVYIGL